MAVVRNLMIRAGADFSSMRKEMARANRNLTDFKSSVSKTMKSIGLTLASLGIGAAIKSATKDAMGFEAAMQQIDRLMGQNAQTFKQWANSQANAFGLSRLEAAKYGATYANLLSGFSSGTAETMQRTQDLLKASAVVASATGRTMEDTLERIRSGLLGNTEAIEDLGINVNVALIESTKSFQKFANGKSWQQLDFNTQQTIRYFAILEQATSKYGLELAKNTNSRQAAFIAGLKNAKLALGQAFLPIYNAILPALTRFATALANVMQYVAAFTQALFGGKTDQQSGAITGQADAVSGLGDAYEKAGKQAKGSVAGFDQVNLIGGAAGGADDGGAGVSVTDANTQTGALDDVAKAMDGLTDKANIMAAKVKSAYGIMTKFIQKNSDLIVAALAGVTTALGGMWLAANGGTIAAGALKSLSSLTALASPVGLIAAAIAALVAAGVWLWKNWDELDTKWKILGTVLLGGMGIVVAVGKNFGWLLDNVFKPLGKYLSAGFTAAMGAASKAGDYLWKNVFQPLSGVVKSFHEKVLVPIADTFQEGYAPAVQAASDVTSFFWNKVLKPFGDFLKSNLAPAIDGIVRALGYLLDKTKPLASFIGGTFVSVLDGAFTSIGEAIDGVKTAFIGLMTFISGVFTGDWRKAWNGVKDIFKGVFESLYAIVKLPLNSIIDAINKVISGLNSLDIDLPEWMGGGSFGLDIPKIPRLANGGLARGPTLAMVGDNHNAAVDPEVIAPLSELEGIMNKNDNREVVAVLKAILGAIKSSDKGSDSVTMSKTALGRAAASSLNDITRRTGKTAFNV